MDNRAIRFILIIIIILGIFFRFYNLDRKIYWHDEVYTIFRSAGFTRDEIDRELFTNQLIPSRELLKYLDIKPKSSIGDTIRSLVTEDPQHPPLYFVINRFWMQLFGNSTFSLRFLPALISLISLPLIYYLTLETFRSWTNTETSTQASFMSLIAVALLALSPVDILFAQTVRQYSSLTLGIIASAYFLIKALRLSRLFNWIYFSLSVAFSLYIHPFFALNLIAFGLFVILLEQKKLLSFLIFSSIALIPYSPWIVVMLSNLTRVTSTTNWATIDVGFDYLAKLWTLSFTSLFFDLDVGFNNIFTYLLRLPFLLVIIGSVFYLFKNTPQKTSFFVFFSAFIPFLILVSADLVLGGKRSAVTRYLISCFPFVQIVVAHLLSKLITTRKTIGLTITALVFIGSISSVVVSSQADTWWNKDLSYNNASHIKIVNQQKEPIVISDLGNDFTNTGDLIAMSPRFNDDVSLLLLSADYPLTKTIDSLGKQLDSHPIFIFRPSQHLLSQLTTLKLSGFDYMLLY
ncbi:MAG: glycosyl transferase family 39 [Cyanobacteria bacterium M5B4]|nr:MAG: glycosyl transferase family 39 [Cyanobacteria bacterium M5B4]